MTANTEIANEPKGGGFGTKDYKPTQANNDFNADDRQEC